MDRTPSDPLRACLNEISRHPSRLPFAVSPRERVEPRPTIYVAFLKRLTRKKIAEKMTTTGPRLNRGSTNSVITKPNPTAAILAMHDIRMNWPTLRGSIDLCASAVVVGTMPLTVMHQHLLHAGQRTA